MATHLTTEGKARLKQLQKAWGRQVDLAAASGVPYGTLQKIMQAKTDPAWSSMLRLAQTTGVSLDWIAFGTGEPYRAATMPQKAASALDRPDTAPESASARKSGSQRFPRPSEPVATPGNGGRGIRYAVLMRLRGLIDRALQGLAD